MGRVYEKLTFFAHVLSVSEKVPPFDWRKKQHCKILELPESTSKVVNLLFKFAYLAFKEHPPMYQSPEIHVFFVFVKKLYSQIVKNLRYSSTEKI